MGGTFYRKAVHARSTLVLEHALLYSTATRPCPTPHAAGREEALVQEGYGGDSDDGIIARSMAYLFEQLAARGAADGCRYNLRCSFAEIYNEQARCQGPREVARLSGCGLSGMEAAGRAAL